MLECLDRSYTIAFTMRSGSNAVCELLARNGLGIPGEWFQTRLVSNNHQPRLNVFTNFVAEHQAGGVFGSKMSHNHRAALDEFLRDSMAGYRRLDDVLPNHRWVELVRRDKVLQAISLCRAESSGWWAHTSGKPSSASYFEYDFFHLLSRVMIIQSSELAWQVYFQRHKIVPYRVVYEDFFQDLDHQLPPLIDYLGGLPARRTSVELRQKHKIQRDHLSENLRERFISDFNRIGESRLEHEMRGSLENWTRFFSEQQWRASGESAA